MNRVALAFACMVYLLPCALAILSHTHVIAMAETEDMDKMSGISLNAADTVVPDDGMRQTILVSEYVGPHLRGDMGLQYNDR